MNENCVTLIFLYFLFQKVMYLNLLMNKCSLEHNLPDSPFASPTKAIGDYMAAFNNNGPNETTDSDASASSANSKFSTNTLLPPSSALDMGSFKSYNCQIPR